MIVDLRKIGAIFRKFREIEGCLFRGNIAYFCALVSSAGVLYATTRVIVSSTKSVTESCMSPAGVGLAVSTLSVVGSAVWFVKEHARYVSLMGQLGPQFQDARLDLRTMEVEEYMGECFDLDAIIDAVIESQTPKIENMPTKNL